MLEFDGSEGEGGGAILRLATAFATILQQPVRIYNIRKKRPKPGLQTQHLIGLNALANLCGGTLKDAKLGAEVITYIPTDDWCDHLGLSIATAGSVGLVFQSIQLAALGMKNRSLEVRCNGGATFGKWAPSIPYIDNVTWKIFRHLNYRVNLKIERHGFYPKGGAKIQATFHPPNELKGIDLSNFTPPQTASILSYATNTLKKAQVAERQAKIIEDFLNKKEMQTSASIHYVDANNPGSGVLVFSPESTSFLAGDFVGEKRLPAENVGKGAVERYLKSYDAETTVDPLLADQVIPILALATSSTVFTTPYISNHLNTNIDIIKRFLDVSIEIYKQKQNYMVSIDV